MPSPPYLVSPHEHVDAVYELTGPAALDIDGLAAAYSAALDRPIHAVRLPYDEWLDHLGEVGLDPHVQQHIATMAKLHHDGRYNRMTTDLQRITGHQAQSVEQYIRLHRNRFGLSP